jgi:branched-chain amino acid transport system ATP-binding protein
LHAVSGWTGGKEGASVTEPLLSVRSVSKSFRGLRAVSDVSFDVEEGHIVALIGPNGAGKTTCFNVIAGVFGPDSGEIRFEGRRIDGLRPDQVCLAGIGRTFQLVKPFAGLSVLDNVIVGALRHNRRVSDARKKALFILDRLGLHDKRDQQAASLTLPDRKRLEVARALATEPRLLLLDEVMAGLRPTETDEMVAAFRRLNESHGITILLIEHVMRAVMALSHEIHVLHHGELIASGSPDDVVRDPAVLDCYLGEEAV